jgi:hypothetical protein
MRPIAKAGAIFAVLMAVTIGLVVRSVLNAQKHSCEVCVTYHGATQCRPAAGSSRDEAVKTATENACAFLASGMTEIVQCQNTRPDSVRCEGE